MAVLRKTLNICALLSMGVALVSAHGGAHQKPLEVDPDADWATRHMAEEHHIGNFDAPSFFTLHDFDDNGVWDADEILTFYGMKDETAKDVTQEKKDEIVREVMRLVDVNRNGQITMAEWIGFCRAGGNGKNGKGELPDFGTGPGHHWDMETEYEIHHWERYHDENTKLEDLTHPEDIEHFRRHDELEDEEEAQAALDRMSIVEHNIPEKFRRNW